MKKFLSLLLALAMTLSLAACGQTKPAETTPVTTQIAETTPVTETAPAAEAAAYPVTVTDQAGRTVTIDEEPQRLVSGYYISTSALIALELEDRLVGVEAKADKRPIYRRSAPELMELPSVGTAKEFDLEGCAALEPDLVILPLKLKNAAQTLEELGIPVLLVNPENQPLLEQMVELIAQATNTGDRARALLDFIVDREAWLTETLAGTESPKVYLAGNSALLSTAGGGMYQSDLIRLAGGENVAAEIMDTYWVEVSYEQLLTWDPEYIILASDAGYSVEEVLADPSLADCAAVKKANVFRMPGDAEAWDSPVPGGILGAVWLASALHPQECSPSERDAVIGEFYETFYGFRYSEN